MSWATLRALWDERDNRYRERRSVLGDAESAAVRGYRRIEVALLAQPERPLAVATLNGWAPPVPLR